MVKLFVKVTPSTTNEVIEMTPNQVQKFINDFAKKSGVSVKDAIGFIECLKVWTDKGYSLEQAIEKNTAQILRMANLHAKHMNSGDKSPLIPFVVDAFFPAI